jgi:putative NADH-flavin reductase
MLLSKALKMQQELEDKNHEVIIGNLKSKIKEQSTVIEKKDFELQTTEGLLAEAEAKITELNTKLLSQSKILIKKSRSLTQNLRPKSKEVQI